LSDFEWRTASTLVLYPDAVQEMERRVEGIAAGRESELFWLVEHPHLYTAGTSAASHELVDPHGFPVYTTGRGGRYTYHGPGQRVVYVMNDLRKRGRDIRAHICRLEEWIIQTLQQFDVVGERREGRVGIWVVTPRGEEKIAAIGVRVRHWVTYHGLAINLAPELENFGGIVPCGLPEFGVTSLHALGKQATIAELDAALASTLPTVFNV
jgi:lipoyl(octanoyl) transferase